MKKTTKQETAKDACRTARRHIARLIGMLEDTMADEAHEQASWPVAGSLGHVRELLAETVGFLQGVEGSEVLDAMINKKNR